MVKFVGRRDELNLALESFQQRGGRVGEASHIELLGPAGIGKTRLLRELYAILAEQGMDVELVVASSPDLAVPFAPFAHLLDTTGLPAHDPTEHLARLASVIASRAEHGNLVLLVDDAHQLDPASVELLHQVMNHSRAHVLVAARPDPGMDERLRSSVRSDNGPSITLNPFNREEFAVVAHDLLAGPIDDLVVDELVRLSDGNPFIAKELISAARTVGALARSSSGRWTLTSRLSVPPSVKDVIRERLRPLEDASLRFLEIIAVAGGLPFRVVEGLISSSDFENLERLGLVLVEQRGERTEARLSHDLYREVILSSSVVRIVAAKRSAVEVLDRYPGDALLELQAARLALDIEELDSDRAFRCARIALRMWDPDLAVALAAKAGPLPSARILLAGALGSAGRQGEAEALFADLESSDDEEVVVQAIAEHAMYLLTHRSDPLSATALLRAGLEMTGADNDEALRASLSLVQFFAGETRGALDTAEPLLSREGWLNPDAGTALAAGWAIAGNPEGVLRTCDRVWETLTNTEPDHYSLVGLNLLWCRLLALTQLGRIREGDVPAAAAPPEIWWPGRDSWVVAASLPASQLSLRGHLAEASTHYERLLERLNEAPLAVSLTNVALIAMLRAQIGDLKGAREALKWCDDLSDPVTGPFRWWIDRARAWTVAVDGDVGAAVHQLLKLSERHAGEWFFTTSSLHDIVRLGWGRSVVGQLEEASSRPNATWFDRLCHDHAVAASSGDASALLSISRRFEEGGLDLFALEAAAHSASAGVGQPGVWQLARQRVDRLVSVCGPVSTPAMEILPSNVTDREVEVARLAARGWSNSRIAQRLGTSTRTVGNQLQSVYGKLHINSREDLSPLFPELSDEM